MLLTRILPLITLLFCAVSQGQDMTFFMGTGDVIVINVYGEPDLNQRVPVSYTHLTLPTSDLV